MHYFQPVPDEIKTEIFQRCNKTEAAIAEDVQSIQQWLKTQSHLPDLLNEDQIRNYTLLCRGSVEKTKRKIDMYFTMRSLYPDIFENSHPLSDRMVTASKYISFIPLPKLTRDLNRILVIKMKDNDPLKMDISALVALLMNVIDVRLFEDLCDGHVIIFDMKHAKLGHAVKVTPTFVKATYTISEKALTTRTPAMHIINTPPFIDQVLLIVKSIIKPKLAERMHVHRGIETVMGQMELDVLPKDYGGTEKSLDELEEQLNQKFLEYKEFFDKREELRVNENRRPCNSFNDDILGYYGNFKKLDVD